MKAKRISPTPSPPAHGSETSISHSDVARGPRAEGNEKKFSPETAEKQVTPIEK